MKEGNQIIDSTPKIRKRRKRGGTNFMGSGQRHRRELKKNEKLSSEGSKSPKKARILLWMRKGDLGG